MARAKKAAGKRQGKTPRYTPSIWLDGARIPKEMRDCKPGEKVHMTMDGVVSGKSESMDGPDSMTIQIRKVTTPPAEAGRLAGSSAASIPSASPKAPSEPEDV